MYTQAIQYKTATDTASKWLGWFMLTSLFCILHTYATAQTENTVHIRNCTNNILLVESYNSWDNDMTLVYQGGGGTAIIPQINGLAAKNGGAGETGEVKCKRNYWFKSYPGCKVKINCGSTNPCPQSVNTLDAGNWVYFSSTRIEQGDVCYHIGAENLIALDFGFEYSLQNKELLRAGGYYLMWQGDGNLVLYGSSGAIWASGTNGKANKLKFQGDGNLVLYNNDTAVWASDTADNEKGGKGGRKLVLNEQGGLSIMDQDYKIIWKVGN